MNLNASTAILPQQLPIQEQNATGQIARLPQEIIEQIMVKLTPSDVSRIRSVCRRMCEISDQLPLPYLELINSSSCKRELKKLDRFGLRLIPKGRLCLRFSRDPQISVEGLRVLYHLFGHSLLFTVNFVKNPKMPVDLLHDMLSDTESENSCLHENIKMRLSK
ncbi:MAG: F-box protein [Pseudomonadota bacterium]|nr:F-box protein [Pseudomonadota bacterium]